MASNIRPCKPSLSMPEAQAFIACVLWLKEAPSRRPVAIAPARIPEPHADLRNRTPEQRSEAGRKGGRKTVADLAPRNAEIMRLWDNGLPVPDMVRALGLTANTIWGVIYRRRSTPSQAQES